MTPAEAIGMPYSSAGFFMGREGKRMIYIYVGIAGAIGAMLRYFIGISLFTDRVFPWATLLINLAGSFLLAWLTTSFFKRHSFSSAASTAIGTGFVGSFTTFSTLSVETVELFKSEQWELGIVYVVISLFGGILMSHLGVKTSKEVKGAC